MSNVPPIVRDLARAELWKRGELDFLLDSNQLEIYRQIHACPILQYVIEAARKIGKSYLLAVIAFETAIKNPKGRINYAAPSGKEAVEITLPIMTALADLAPPEVRPVWLASVGHWQFPNGAFIALFGADDRAAAQRGRGPSSVLNIVDEAAFCPVLLFLIEDVLAPQTLLTKGRTLIASTPPESPGHDFVSIAEAAAAQNAYAHRDIYSHGRMTLAQIDEYLTQRAASRNMTLEQYKTSPSTKSTYQREYLAQRALDSTLGICPEFPDHKDAICVARPRPAFFNYFVAGDPGMADFTGILFAYYDFARARIVVEHELLLIQANTGTIAREIKAVLLEHYKPNPRDTYGHQKLWTWISPKIEPDRCQAPYAAVVDEGRKRLCDDLWADHKLSFSPAQTDDREESINQLRLVVQRRGLEINPRCVHLIRQLGTAVRTKIGGDMARTKIDGHYDLVAAIRMLLRAVSKSNPFPDGWGLTNPQFKKNLSERKTLAKALLGNSHIGRKLQRKIRMP